MKKVLALTLVLMSVAGSAFAVSGGTTLTSTSGVATAGAAIFGGSTALIANAATNPIVKLSSGVSGMSNYDVTSYAIATKHIKGSKIFGTAADSTNMYWKASPAAIINATEFGSGSANANFGSWTSM